MRRTLVGLLPLVLLALVAGGCSSAPEDGPGASVQKFHQLLNDGDYAAAKDLYGVEARTILDDPNLSSDEAYREWAKMWTREGSISTVEIVGTEEQETTAVVEYEIHYADGSVQAGSVTLSHEDGVWKLGLIG